MLLKKTAPTLAALITMMVLGYLVYSPGLSGGFIFDDISSLSNLKVINDEITVESLKQYIGSSETGPLRRPISVFSFLIDGTNWPTDAYPFKRTNIIIHLLNGGLLFFLLLAVFKFKGLNQNQRLYIAFFSASMWLFHPFLVSTTLYVVQRMAMLPATFFLLGLLLYLKGRSCDLVKQRFKAHLLLFSAVYGMTLLAVLSKENGVLLIWLIALFELFIIQRFLQWNKLPRYLSLLLIKIPVIVVMALLLLKLPGFLVDYNIRIFDMHERILTQTRVVSKYIYHLLVPDYFTAGVFNDGYIISKGFLQPITTLYSTLFISAILIGAWLLRKRLAWLSFAVFFFFIAQILESTIIPLELYFEHRVYAASLFIFVPLTLLFVRLGQQSKIYLIIPLMIVILLGFYTHMRSNVWGNNLELHQLTMDKFPESVRARVATAVLYEDMGLNSDAYQIIEKGTQELDNLELKLNLLTLKCQNKTIQMADIDSLSKAFKEVPFTKHDFKPYTNLIKIILQNDCLPDNKIDVVSQLAASLKNNKNYKLTLKHSVVLFVEGQVALMRGDYELAKTLYLDSFKLSDKDYGSLINAVIELVNNKQYDFANELLDYLEKFYQADFRFKIDWTGIGENIKGFRALIEELKKNEVINHNTSKK